jgi:hypothetical protein
MHPIPILEQVKANLHQGGGDDGAVSYKSGAEAPTFHGFNRAFIQAQSHCLDDADVGGTAIDAYVDA